ncbi:uncharacterized protein LOC135212011 [Macrobrachium nipponense]|uniref:uncharacterized protein LOC135212011 n=1 Tax=Macrobrachium nipponense TaxID=159736 RepID=UPI0030C8BD44
MERENESASSKRRLTPKLLRTLGYTLVAVLFLINITYMVYQPRPPYWFIVVVVLGVVVAIIHYTPCPCVQEEVTDRRPSVGGTEYGSIDIQDVPEPIRSLQNSSNLNQHL